MLEFPEGVSFGKPSLGVVTISFNEQRDMPGFLANLIDWVDEIVIVDDGSSDRTEEIVAQAGPKVRFIRSPRAEGEYYSHQRNKGIDAADSDWLLHMDVDERVTPELAHEIQLAIRDEEIDGYRYRRLNYFMHRPMRGGGWQDWNLVHLARRDKFRFGGMFHEDCIIDSPENRIGQLSGQMVHFNEENFEKRLRKSSTYMEEVVKGIENSNRVVRTHDIIGRTVFEFLKKYIVKKGFLDGAPGIISAMHSATAVFRAYAVVWDRQNRIPRTEIEKQLKDRWDKRTG